jgi:hypothetical protein
MENIQSTFSHILLGFEGDQNEAKLRNSFLKFLIAFQNRERLHFDDSSFVNR